MRVKKAYEKFGSRSFVPSAIPATNGVGEGDVLFYGSTSVNASKVYYLSGGGWVAADADTDSSGSNLLAIAMGTGTASSVGMMLRGVVHHPQVNTADGDGKPVYLSSTAGSVTMTTPTAYGANVRIIGYQLSMTKFWFSPDNSYIKLEEE